MERQKKLALVNDVTGYGRCSIAVELPIVSALKIQGCILPTAILSVHTAFENYYMDDYAHRMKPYIASWKKNNVTFDGIVTGFLGSADQIDIVLDFIRTFKTEHTKVIVDPVMGDDGLIYTSYTAEMCENMRRLVAAADVITPNLTEACQLLGMPYGDDEISLPMLEQMATALAAMGPKQIVITGLHDGSDLLNYMYEEGKHPGIVRVKKIGTNRPGTGDVFTAIVSALLVRGESLGTAVQTAADFISKAMVCTERLHVPINEGLAFEEILTDLR